VYESIKEKEDFKFMMAFGLGFITVLFMGFLTGYMIGSFVLGWKQD
jgi:hypothetical protein